MEFCLECTHVPALGDGVVSLAPQGKVGGGGGGGGPWLPEGNTVMVVLILSLLGS